jgi:hypothetical protein
MHITCRARYHVDSSTELESTGYFGELCRLSQGGKSADVFQQRMKDFQLKDHSGIARKRCKRKNEITFRWNCKSYRLSGPDRDGQAAKMRYRSGH